MPEDVEAQKRIYPELRITHRTMFARILGIGFALFGLGMLIWGVTHLMGTDLDAALLLLGAGFIYGGASAAGLDPGEWLMAIAHRRAWHSSQATTQAEIVKCTARRHKDSYGDISYTYWIVLRFDCSRGETVLKARVSKAQYDRLEEASTVTVRYAARNPRIALLEGE